jgi:hypothetical protein
MPNDPKNARSRFRYPPFGYGYPDGLRHLYTNPVLDFLSFQHRCARITTKGHHGGPFFPGRFDDDGLCFCTLAAAQDGGYESIHHVGIMGGNSISENMAKERTGKNRIHGLFPSIIWVA